MDFSFIIPVYNCKVYLADCVESVLASGISSLEILLVDDGSTDGSGALCDTLSKADSRIRVIHQDNAGVSAARNTGLREARGECLLFADADDTLDSRELPTVLTDPRCLQSDLTLFGVSFDYYHHGSPYRSDALFYSHNGILSPDLWGKEIHNLYLSNSLSSIWNKVFKRSIIEKNGLTLDNSMFLYEDMEFVLRYLACCNSIWNVPKAIYHYRQSEDEGNAGRRLSRISHITQVINPIDAALQNLRCRNSSISSRDCDGVLQMLYLTLVREKAAVSNAAQIRCLCREYQAWEKEHITAAQPSTLRSQLLQEQIFSIRFQQIAVSLRHRMAVTAKSILHRLRCRLSHS